jgi:coenzyme F420-0:L-glutamate ligase/coenzyme F420-1:gamma-L-glutamate ligase
MTVSLLPVQGMPWVKPGDDLAALLIAALAASKLRVESDDVLVVCQKVVSKAEGRIVRLADVEVDAQASEFAKTYDKNPAVVQSALNEASEILRMGDGHLITATGPGWICANSGIDRSNQNDDDEITLLPLDSDASARDLRERLTAEFGVELGVVISDTFGRPWRMGQLDVAIGVAGFEPLDDHEGRRDWADRPLEHTLIAVADQIAAAAGLLAGKADGVPAVLVKGAPCRRGPGRASDLVRPKEDDLFR